MEVMRKLFLIPLVCLLFSGCSSISEESKSVTVKAKVNQVSKFDNSLSIEVKSVTDSRCPKGANCFWEGEVRVNLTLIDGGNSMDTCLVLPSHPMVQFMNYSVELIDVTPYPDLNNQSPSDYIFTFQVSVLRLV
jgi:hypothetical protein